MKNIPDMRIIWMNQINLLGSIAEDIIKNGPTAELHRYLTREYPFVLTEWPDDEGGSGDNVIRLNYGEAYAYVELDNNLKPTGKVTWDVTEMGIDDGASLNTEELTDKLFTLYMSKEQAYEIANKVIDVNDCYSEKDQKVIDYKPL